MPWFLLVSCSLAGILWWMSSRRVKRSQIVTDGAPRCRIEDLEEGRFRVAGKIVAIDSTQSPVDGWPCVYLEHADYSPVPGSILMKETDRYVVGHTFHLDDGTGVIVVDPTHAAVEAVTLHEDGGLTAERRLRAGEEVEVMARFERVSVEAEGGPYRAGALAWAATGDRLDPPFITYRTDPGMVTPMDDLTVFMRGAGALLVAVSSILSALVLL